MYYIYSKRCGSESCCHEETIFFDSFVKAISFFNILLEEDIKSRQTAREYGNYYFGDLALYSNNRLIASN